MSAPARTFTVRNIQLLRALFAAASALMITFSPDHSAAVGFAVFGGFVAASGFIFVLGAWLAVPSGSRWPLILLGVIDLLTAVVSGIPTWRTDGAFFIVVIIWAAASGLVELVAGLRARRTDPTAKDAITIGALGLVLAVVLLFIPAGYSLQYSVEGTDALTLTGIILAVGMFGGYTAIVAVFLGIAGFSPDRTGATEDETKDADTDDATSASVENGGAS
ncbi:MULTISPECIES: acyl-CoA synthetase [Microbacterium]|uniref:Acyl-CoA synthetase n=1 Tax=Microbacterium profundi TaxID=450380 RepID=A0ABV3LDS9_9MICO|nr:MULTISPECIES: acyl-CoA synthetase [Microbacterium]MCE7482123.1 acyl-CoA synthetase [Microbacterium profundi]